MLHTFRIHIIFFVLALVCVAASAATFRPAHVVQQTLQSAIVPVAMVVEGLRYGTNAFSHKIYTHFQTVRQKEWLLKEFAQINHLRHQLVVTKAENAELRALLNMAEGVEGAPVAARVLADSASPFSRSIIINAGSQSGVQKGHAVLTTDGVIGRVIQVFANHSRVLLMTDYAFRLPVRVVENSLHGVLQGTGRMNMKMLLQQKDDPLKAGMKVVTSGVGGVFQPNLPVGVVAVGKGGEVSIQPYANFARLNIVVVQTKKVENIIGGTQ